MSDHQLQQRLMRKLHFTESDLEANRQGRLSDRQKAFFQQSLDPRSWWPYTIYMLVAFAGIFLYALFIDDIGENIRGDTTTLVIMGGMLVSPLLVHAGAAIWARWYSSRMDRWRVRAVEGEAKIVESEHEVVFVPLKAYRLKIGRKTFHLSGPQASAFTNGAIYRVYFVRTWMPKILSAEVISREK
jgi:hypothetical protein